MKKIKDHRIKKYKSREEKREKRIKLIMGLILAFLMFFSIFGMWATSLTSNVVKINEYKFKMETNEAYSQHPLYVTKVNNEKVYFYLNPENTMNTKLDFNLTDFFSKSDYFFITSNPTTRSGSIADNVRYELEQYSNKNFMLSFDNNYTGYENYPIINCDNASEINPVIYFEENKESTNITLENNCLKLIMNFDDARAIRDRLLLSALNIVNE